MPLDRIALDRSLESLIEEGKEPLDFEEYRDYVVLYNNTLKYIKDNQSESETLKELYPRFPEIELKEFNKPIDYILGFIFSFFEYQRASGSQSILRYNPRWIKYRNDLYDNQRLIYTLASEMIMRVGE
jgi:hypothetical protein